MKRKDKGLTEPQKIVLTTLRRNKGSYMKKTINHAGTEKYKVYDPAKNPIAWASKSDVVYLSNIKLLVWQQDGTAILDHDAYNKFYNLKPAIR